MLRRISLACRALSDPTRLRIVKLLAVAELPVCELVFLLAAGQSRVSQNLTILKRAELVTCVRRGQLVYYSLNRQRIERMLADLQDLISPGDLGDVVDMRDEAERFGLLHRSGRPALGSAGPAYTAGSELVRGRFS